MSGNKDLNLMNKIATDMVLDWPN